MFFIPLIVVSSNFMRQQAMSSRMVFNRPIPVNRLVSSIADSESVLVDYAKNIQNIRLTTIVSFQRHK